jgi:hypothetical protein
MRLNGILILIGAAVPAAAAAESAPLVTAPAVAASAATNAADLNDADPTAADPNAAPAPVLHTRWTLKQPKRKPGQVASAEGPAVPADPRVRLPASPRQKRATADKAKPQRVNIAPLVARVSRGKQN